MSHISLANLGHVEWLLTAAFAAPWLMIPVVAVFSWIDDVHWRRRMKALQAKAGSKNVADLARLVAQQDGAFSKTIVAPDGTLHPVYAGPVADADEPGQVWEVYSPVWSERDGPLDSRRREKLQQLRGLVLAAGPRGGDMVWRRVGVPGRVQLDELWPVMERVGQDACQLRDWLKRTGRQAGSELTT